MGNVLKKMTFDFLSTIVFIAIYMATDDVLIATVAAVVMAVGQLIYARARGVDISFMTFASLALVVALGAATLLTHDPRFVLLKPSIAHFAIGAIMLKPGWMSRYMPPTVNEEAPDLPVIAGYAWAALMFVLGLGTIATALSGDMKLWTFYVTVVLVGAKVVAFALQWMIFRIVIRRRIIARKRAAAA